jgi:hypothetical protein
MRSPFIFGLSLAAGLLSAPVPSTAAAQAPRWQIGVVGGVNSARFSDMAALNELAGMDASISQERRTDMLVGLAFTREMSRTVDFVPELLFTRKGGVMRADVTFPDGFFGSDGPQTFTSRGSIAISYLELPALVRIRLPQMAKGTPYLLVGPTLSLRVACRAKMESTSTSGGSESSSDDCDEEDDESGMRKNDIGALAGVGMMFNSVALSLRYERGLRSLSKDDDPDPITNRVFSLTATYMLGGRK